MMLRDTYDNFAALVQGTIFWAECNGHRLTKWGTRKLKAGTFVRANCRDCGHPVEARKVGNVFIPTEKSKTAAFGCVTR